jgi:hypothetical protein
MSGRPLPGVRLPVPEIPPMSAGGAAARRYGPEIALVHHVTRTVRLLTVPPPAALCRLGERLQVRTDRFCAPARPFLDRRTFRYGWEVYRIDPR